MLKKKSLELLDCSVKMSLWQIIIKKSWTGPCCFVQGANEAMVKQAGSLQAG